MRSPAACNAGAASREVGRRRTYYYGTDHLGTTTVMFDGRGDAVWKGETSPFGNDAATSGSLDETVRFTGKEFDEAAVLYYFNARWYDASLGRFTSEDPARDEVNWYVYVGNRPLGAVDPTGMISFGPIKDLIFAFADQSNCGIDAILGGLHGDKGSQAMVKQVAENVAVDVLRDGADAAELVSDGASIVALGATATGALPVAGGAMGVAKGADFAALGMNISADAIQGEFSADTFAGAVNLGVGFSLGRVLPKYNIGSKRFHNLIGSNRGRFVTDNVGKATQIFFSCCIENRLYGSEGASI